MQDFYPHVYLSPHLDDAVLSCGGLIHRQVAAGQRPLVVTLFAGKPPTDVELSPFARSLHAGWGDPQDVTATRLAEDQAALSLLGADYLRLNYLDCIYRGEDHQWHYPSEEALFGGVHPSEEEFPKELATALAKLMPRNDVTLYAPLTVGNHVDHQLAFAAALILKKRGWQVRLYEDYPYAQVEGALAEALTAREVTNWQAKTIPLTRDDLQAKIEAIACYESQLKVLFGGVEVMGEQVKNHLARMGGERLWIDVNARA